MVAATCDAIWPVISNPESIAVNQAYAGYSGTEFKVRGAGRGRECVHERMIPDFCQGPVPL